MIHAVISYAAVCHVVFNVIGVLGFYSCHGVGEKQTKKHITVGVSKIPKLLILSVKMSVPLDL